MDSDSENDILGEFDSHFQSVGASQADQNNTLINNYKVNDNIEVELPEIIPLNIKKIQIESKKYESFDQRNGNENIIKHDCGDSMAFVNEKALADVEYIDQFLDNVLSFFFIILIDFLKK